MPSYSTSKNWCREPGSMVPNLHQIHLYTPSDPSMSVGKYMIPMFHGVDSLSGQVPRTTTSKELGAQRLSSTRSTVGYMNFRPNEQRCTLRPPPTTINDSYSINDMQASITSGTGTFLTHQVPDVSACSTHQTAFMNFPVQERQHIDRGRTAMRLKQVR